MLNNRLIQLLLGALLSISLVVLLPSFILWLDLDAFEKQQIQQIFSSRLLLLLSLTTVGLMIPVVFFSRFYHRHLRVLNRLSQQLNSALKTDIQSLDINEELPPEEQALIRSAHALVSAVHASCDSINQELSLSSSTRLREKTRLTALLNQLSQGVLVCNIEGHILLANGRARSMLDQTQGSSALSDSLFSLLDAELVAHALTIVRERLESGIQTPSTTLSAISRSGKLVRLQLAAAVNHNTEGADQVEGFVVILEDIEEQHTQSHQRDKLLQGLTRETRNLLTRLRTGLDSLQRDRSASAHQRTLLTALSRDTVRHCDHLERLSFQRADQLAHTWPLETILSTDLISTIQQQLQRVHQLQLPFHVSTSGAFWLEADSFSLAQGVANCISALRVDWGLDDIRLSTDIDPKHPLLLIHISWLSGELRQEDFRALATSTQQSVAVGGRALVELIERHGGRAWLEERREGQQLCVALPLCESPPGADISLPGCEFDFSAAADSTAQFTDDTPLRQQYVSVVAVGFGPNSTADMSRGNNTLVALLLAGGKPQALAQKQLHQATLTRLESTEEASDLNDLSKFSRKGIFITHAAENLLEQLNPADRRFISQAGLLDTQRIAELLFPELTSYGLFQVASRLGLEAEASNATEQVKLIARVFNRSLTRLQQQGIHSYEQLQAALAKISEREQA